MCYTVFVWNYKVQLDEMNRYKMYKQSLHNPIEFQDDFEYKTPVIAINKEMHLMVPLDEFLERLEAGKERSVLKYRACDNLVDNKKTEELE